MAQANFNRHGIAASDVITGLFLYYNQVWLRRQFAAAMARLMQIKDG